MSNVIKRVSVATELGKMLSGKIVARRDFAKVCNSLAGAAGGTIVVLDFQDVDYASGSWINWMLVPFVMFESDANNDYYPVISHFPEGSIDDLRLVADTSHSPFLISDQNNLQDGQVIGQLDPVQKLTLERVASEREVTGASLADEEVKATAWNNRLRDLNTKRLIRRRKEGREQIYSVLISEVKFDG